MSLNFTYLKQVCQKRIILRSYRIVKMFKYAKVNI